MNKLFRTAASHLDKKQKQQFYVILLKRVWRRESEDDREIYREDLFPSFLLSHPPKAQVVNQLTQPK